MKTATLSKINTMKKIKVLKLTKLVIIFIVLTIGCSSIFKNSTQFNPDIDCNEPDSASFDFASFQVLNKHPSRSIEVIRQKIELKKMDLLNLKTEYQKFLSNSNEMLFTFQINCYGQVNCFVDSVTLLKDTTFNKKVNKILSDIKFDSLSQCNSVAKVKGMLIKRNGISEFNIYDSVLYYQGRSKKSIMCIVYPNLKQMRNKYNKYLRDDGYFRGKITVKFAINEFGKVIFAEIAENTTNRKDFAEEELNLVKSWQFQKIYNPGDVTEVIYPFIFSY